MNSCALRNVFGHCKSTFRTRVEYNSGARERLENRSNKFEVKNNGKRRYRKKGNNLEKESDATRGKYLHPTIQKLYNPNFMIIEPLQHFCCGSVVLFLVTF